MNVSLAENRPAADSSVAAVALSWAARGIPVFPCKPQTKAPYISNGFKAATTDETTIRQWWQQFPQAMIGVPTGSRSGFWALDPDAPSEPGKPDGRATLRELEATHGKLPFTHTHETPRGGLHYCFKWNAERPIKNEAALDERGINVRGEGGYVIAPPSVRHDGKQYRFADPLDAYRFEAAPDWLYDIILAKPEKPTASISERATENITRPRSHRAYAETALREEAAIVRATGSGNRNKQLNKSAFNLGTLVGANELTENEVVQALYQAAQGNGLVADDGDRSVRETIKSGLRGGIRNPRVIVDRPSRNEASSTSAQAEGTRSPEFTDENLAIEFADRYADELRYVAPWSKWLRWNGERWETDETLYALHLARGVCSESAAECNKPNIARQLASAKTIAAVERLAKADRRLAATTEQWDADPWILNTPGGVCDLKTGTSRPHDPNDYLTKITGAAPGGACPTWRTFLDRVTNGDKELQAFIQRMSGYSLTGDTSAHALFFAYGTGANGKSVMISTLAGILGDYHKTAPIETFTASTSERHPTDIAGLRGARLVTAIETEEGRRWAESKIKAMTGGDKMSARFMRQDFFEFTPQFKLLVAGNHRPGLRSIDEAIRRRFNLLPFTVTIPPEERDEALTDKLKAEWPGILAWMIEGCLAWQRDGLAAPSAVIDATAAYLDSEDALAAWIDECCEMKKISWESSTRLFASWKEWADQSGEISGSAKRFGQTLETRGFEPRRGTELGRPARGFTGLRIVPKAYDPDRM